MPENCQDISKKNTEKYREMQSSVCSRAHTSLQSLSIDIDIEEKCREMPRYIEEKCQRNVREIPEKCQDISKRNTEKCQRNVK